MPSAPTSGSTRPLTPSSPAVTPAPLLIVQLDAPHCSREGDWYYRTFAPGRAMADLPGVFVVNLDNVHRRKLEALREADVLILNSVVDSDLLPVLRERRQARRLTVYEVSDDVSAVPPWNPVHSFFKAPENLRLLLRLAHSSDANQYSVEELRRVYGHLNARQAVFRNQLMDAPPPRSHAARKELVVGWGGSKGHLEDMAAVAAPLMEWIARRPEARLDVMGADSIWRLFDALPAAHKRHVRPGPIADYYRFLDGLDVGLAPLADTAFNRSRSDVKFLEYAAHGVVPVVQEARPYLDTALPGRTALLFRDAAGMIAALEELATRPQLRRELADGAYHYAARERIQADHVAERLDFYRAGLAELGHVPRAAAESATAFASLSRCEGAELRGRHAVLCPTRFERLLHDGLVLSQQQHKPLEAAAAFRAAARLEPADYQPWLFQSTAGGPSVMDDLGQALRRNPRSLQACIALGMQLARRRDPTRAIERFLAAAELCPTWELPHACVAQVLREMGAPDEAARFELNAHSLLRPLLPGNPHP